MKRKNDALNLMICVALLTTTAISVLAQKTRIRSAPKVKIAKLHAFQGDLPYLRAVNTSNGAVFKVYYDASSARTAAENIPLLASFFTNLAEIMGVDAGAVNWHSVVFTQDKNYVSPHFGTEVRWTVRVDETGNLGTEGIEDLYQTIPHEQVHAIQKIFMENLPRWFAEGQAEWGGLQIAERWQPKLAEKRRANLAMAIREAKSPLNLQCWGAVRIKPEAILRQLTPEQREKMQKDPSYEAPGPFTFTPADYISDESNMFARYGGAMTLFSGSERNFGRAKMQNLFKEI